MRAALALVVLLMSSSTGWAETPRAQAALVQLFPEADHFAPRDVLLTDEMAARLEKLAHARVAERMVTFYSAQKAGQTLGWAVVHTHTVRTKHETLAVGFELDGSLRRVDVVTFLEPEEYRPTQAWLDTLKHKSHRDRLAPGVDVPVISGASLSARAITDTARWLLEALRATGGADGGTP